MISSGEIEKAAEDWEIDFPKSIIERKKILLKERPFDFFFPRIHKVEALYRFIISRQDDEDGIVFSQAMRRQEKIDGISRGYELINGYEIPKKDLKLLREGPLAQNGKILVPVNRGLARLKVVLSNPIVQTLLALATITSLLVSVL